ncbi:MAG: hypothetical protein WC272_01480 [Sulfurimonas sp.]|jgi:hypothetical protein
MKVKYIVLAVLAMFSFSGCDEEYAKVPFSVPVDFSKKGTVYETNFQAPWNVWSLKGSPVQLYIGMRTPDYRTGTDEEKRINNYIRTGVYRDADGKLIPTLETPYFKLKVTFTPLGWASDEVTIWTGAYFESKATKHEFKDGKKIEFVVSVPLYGGEKIIMIADLQRLRNYHIRIESLEDVELPQNVSTVFDINRIARK